MYMVTLKEFQRKFNIPHGVELSPAEVAITMAAWRALFDAGLYLAVDEHNRIVLKRRDGSLLGTTSGAF